MSTAIALAFFFGPLGLFYSSLIGGVVMLTASVIILVPLLLGLHMNGVLFFPDWVVCVIWAAFASWPHTPQVADDREAERAQSAAVDADGAPGGS